MERKADDTTPSASDQTGTPAHRAAGAFVGRGPELDVLASGFEEAVGGRGRLFLVSGEPGIGKTRLADEFSERARERGARVLWGRCWEAGGAPAYWPWVQALRSYIGHQDPEQLRALLGTGAVDVSQMLPELRDSFPDLPELPSLNPDTARFRLFDSATAFLKRAAMAQPLVLVLDDIHAADTPSLRLLEFLASQLGDSRLLLLCGFRDVAPALNEALLSSLTQLAREPVARRLALGGLAEAEVHTYLELVTGRAPAPSVVTEIHRETEGNPLFVEEVVRLLVSEGRLEDAAEVAVSLPEGVRQVIGLRLARLSEPCRRVLTLASVLGRDFSLDALERVSGGSGDELLAVLDEAASERVVTEVPGVLVRLRFSHALIRDVLYEEIPSARRRSLHRAAGEALEELYAGDLDPHLAELAHHFLASGPDGKDRGISYARRAGDRAMRLLAFEEATRRYRTALEALDLKGAAEEQARCDLLLAMGEAQMRSGEDRSSKQTFLRAAGLARESGWAERLARAALGYGGRFVWFRAGRDTRLVPLLEEALTALGGAETELRVRVLARLAGALRDEPSRERRGTLSGRAVEIACRLGDPDTLAYALVSRLTAIWGPENTQELLEIASEIVRLGEDVGASERALEGYHLRFVMLLILGDRAGADAQLEESARISEEVRQPPQDWYVAAHRNVLLLLEGRLHEAEELIPGALDIVLTETMDADVAYRLQLFGLRKDQGRIGEVEAVIRRSVDDYPWYPMFRCALAHLYAELGQEREARLVFAELARDGFAAIPRDIGWLFGMSLLPEVAAFLGDLEAAATMYDLLEPYAGLVAFSPPELCLGAVSRGLGVLATTLSRFEEAAVHFEEAVETNERLRARPWAARTRYDHARMLLSRDAPGDRERALDLLAQAHATSRELGMAALEGEVSGLLGDLGVEHRAPELAEAPAAPATARPRPSIFRREGDYFSIAFEGEAFRLKDAKGLRYLALLLGSPGREIHVLDLVAGADGGPPSRARADRDLETTGGGDAGEVIDAKARAAYTLRLKELREELEEAESFGDAERASRANEEMEFLARELAGGVGLGGRLRKSASSAERARMSVAKAIRSAMERIAGESPALGRHLQSTIHTGTFCRYEPDPRAPISWRL